MREQKPGVRRPHAFSSLFCGRGSYLFSITARCSFGEAVLGRLCFGTRSLFFFKPEGAHVFLLH